MNLSIFKPMRWLAALLGLTLTASAQTNVLYGYIGDYGLAEQSNVLATLTLVSPNPRVVNGIFVRRDPVSTRSGNGGYFSFTNIIWGKYTLALSGSQTTSWTLNVGTNTEGTVSLGSLATTITPAPPDPSTNYYTQQQIDAIIANVVAGDGGFTNGSQFLDLSGWLQFTNAVNPAYSTGRVFYDNSQNTLAYYNDSSQVTVNVGQEQLVRARNNTGALIEDGKAVYITGATGQTPTIALAVATNLDKGNAVGLSTHNITNNTVGYVTVQGLVNGINTSAFDEGAKLYVSSTTPGELTTNTTSGAVVGYCVYQHSQNGKILVNVTAANLDGAVTNGQQNASIGGVFAAGAFPRLVISNTVFGVGAIYAENEEHEFTQPMVWANETTGLGEFRGAFNGDFTGNGSGLTNLSGSAPGLTNVAAAGVQVPDVMAPLVLPSLDGTNKHTHPSVIALNPPWNGYTLAMAYTPFPDASRENPSVVVSQDGVRWVTPPGGSNPVVYGSNRTAHGFSATSWPADPCIARRDDGSFALFYIFSDNNAGVLTQECFVKISSDLVTWTAPTALCGGGGSTNVSLACPVAKKIGNQWRLYYVSGLGGTNYGTRLRYRTLGTDFLSVGAENICALTNAVGRTTMPWHFDIFPGAIGGTNRWWILYGGTGAGPGSNGDSQLECAESPDGVNWIPRFWPAWQPGGINTNWSAIYKPAVLTIPGVGYDFYLGASSPTGNTTDPSLPGWEIFRQRVQGQFPVANRSPLWNVRGETNNFWLGYTDESTAQPDTKLALLDNGSVLKLGGIGSGYSGIWTHNNPRATTNFALGGNTTETILNAKTVGYFRTNNNGVALGGWNSSGLFAHGLNITNSQGSEGTSIGRISVTNSGWQRMLFSSEAFEFNAGMRVAGPVESTAGSFYGNGAGLTNVSLATATGTLPMGALTAQSPVGTNGFLTTDGSARSYSRDGQFLTNLSAAELSLGTVPSARLTGVGITNPVIYGTATLSNAYVAGPLKMSNSHAIQWPDSGGTLRNVLVYDSSDNVTLSGKSAVTDVTIGQSTALVVKSSGSTVLGAATTGGSRLAVSGGVSVGTGWRTNLAPTNGIIVEGTAAFGGLVLASNLSLSIGFTNAGVSTFRDDVSLDATADFSMAGGAVMSVAGVGRFGSATVSNTLTASNVVLSAMKWVDCASHIYWATGKGTGSSVTNSVDIIEAGDGTLAMAFSQTNGAERLPFVAEVPHTIADTNATITAASLYTEAHIHVRPLTNATTLTNVAFQIIWKGCGDKLGATNGPAVTNTITFVVGSSNTTQLVEANPMLYTTFHPSVAATFPGTWTRVAASSNNYPGPILIQTPSVHVPVGWPNAIGSTADNAP